MLKNHLAYRRIVDSTCPQQFRKECAFFPALMVIICKCAQEPQKRPNVFRSDGLTLLCALGHRLKHFERAQNNLVILNQKIGAFHEDLQLLQSPCPIHVVGSNELPTTFAARSINAWRRIGFLMTSSAPS